ncbi:glycosyltransferase family 4 protein [Mangrovimonas xylaniphaga]|uniref:glycosyltransferase family 4 protein n=1 Tax=Mangrovimonas xylaniphaga TaxID=1645915 RepID=UPI0006B64C29|nr:glycosyltransferase family 4 protein [Mangrovimonas xylaniphaga]
MTSEFPPLPGGIGNHAYNLAKHLEELGYQVIVITDQRALDAEEEHLFDAGQAFFIKRAALRQFRWSMYVKRLQLLFRYVKQTEVVFATGKFSLWSVALCTLFFKRKYIAIVHGSEVNFKTFLLRRSVQLALKRFDRLIAVSNYTKGLVTSFHGNIEVIPNGIALSQWRPPQTELFLKGSPILTTVGRVSSRKGQLQVIGLLPELIQSFPELHYHCIGIPTEAKAFKEEAQRLGVADHVTFHGALNDEGLRGALVATDVFVMLSKESVIGDVEGYGIAILEANAMSKPAIGSKGCGIEDAIDDGRSGLLVTLDDVRGFKAALTFILDHYDQFSENAKQWAEVHDWRHIIKTYDAVISSE